MTQYRRYQDVAEALRGVIRNEGFVVGDRLPPERQLSDRLSVSRSLVREALIMLEIDGLVEVRKGSGIYLAAPSASSSPPVRDDIGPFELLQARQLLESSIAAFAAEMVTKNDIIRMREALDMERQQIEIRQHRPFRRRTVSPPHRRGHAELRAGGYGGRTVAQARTKPDVGKAAHPDL